MLALMENRRNRLLEILKNISFTLFFQYRHDDDIDHPCVGNPAVMAVHTTSYLQHQ